jgi:hypothetical protein
VAGPLHFLGIICYNSTINIRQDFISNAVNFQSNNF